jgi:CelD/BcsL family acetyltransferase involved in cellulose biosynthesis
MHDPSEAVTHDGQCVRRTAERPEAEPVAITAVKFADLTRDEIDAWSALQRRHPTFENPFFRPEFSALLSTYEDDIEVAVLRMSDRCVGFWPFQRGRGNVACADGRGLRSYEGVVCDPGVSWSPEALLEGCRLSAWKFEHLLDSQANLRRFYWKLSKAPVIDLADDSETFLERKRRERSRTIELVLRKVRRLERDVGRVRLVSSTDDDCVLDAIIEWKRAQFKRIRIADHLKSPRRRELVKRVAAFQSEDFAGMTSALYAGKHLLAAHLGIRSRALLHGWLPVYNRSFQRYSPGIVMWALLADEAPRLGITRIDLAKGHEDYKEHLKTGDRIVAEGAVDPWFVSRSLRKGWWHARRKLLASPVGEPLRKVVRIGRALFG